jgi:hypothetical protein
MKMKEFNLDLKKPLRAKILQRLSVVYREGSGLRDIAEAGLCRLTLEELRALWVLVMTSTVAPEETSDETGTRANEAV